MNTLAEKQGRRAFAEGYPRTANPYRYHFLKRGWWFYGWDDAARLSRGGH